MSGPFFDHESERKLPRRTSVVAASICACIALVATLWIAAASRTVDAADRGDDATSRRAERLTDVERGEIEELRRAAAAGELETVVDLVARGVDVNVRGATGESALHAAVAAGEAAIARELLSAGARADTDARGTASTLHLAAARDDVGLVELLLAAGAPVDARATQLDDATPLHVAAEASGERTLAALLRAEAEVDAVDARGLTALAHAALLGRADIVQALIRAGADTRRVDSARRTPLHFAAAVGDEESVRALLDVHADVRAVDAQGWTALHFAAAHGRASLVPLFARNMERDSLDARTARGDTALHLAARSGDPRCVEALLDVGLDATARDDEGRRACDLAPLGVRGEPWSRLGVELPQPAPRAPEPALLDARERRPAIVASTRRAHAGSSRVLLDFALWDDGAAVLIPWRSDGKREYAAGVVPPERVGSLLRDLEETGCLDAADPTLDRAHADCVEIAVLRDGKLSRCAWDEVQHADFSEDAPLRAAIADANLRWTRARDVLRTAQPRSSRAMDFVQVRGAFRGLSFEDGGRAAWLD